MSDQFFCHLRLSRIGCIGSLFAIVLAAVAGHTFRKNLNFLNSTLGVEAGSRKRSQSKSVFNTARSLDKEDHESKRCELNTLCRAGKPKEEPIEMKPKNALQHARNLMPPAVMATLNGEHEGYEYWNEHNDLLNYAWHEWEHGDLQEHLTLSSGRLNDFDYGNVTEISLMDDLLRERVLQVRASPTSHNEAMVKELWTEVLPGVFRGTLLKPCGIRYIRSIFDAVQIKSKIPRRRPNGMNRYGIIINDLKKYSDEDSMSEELPGLTPGGVSLEALSTAVHRIIIDRYVRPLGRMLFPDRIGQGDDNEAYAFTIRYSSEEDVELKEHNDASVVTLNVNLNIPEDEAFEGSSVTFVDQSAKAKAGGSDPTTIDVSFDQPGMALIHLGQVRHSAQPITKGERQNLVIWLFGSGGYVRIAPYDKDDKAEYHQMFQTPTDRWEEL